MLNKLLIALSNKLAALRRSRVLAEELLVLIPHCLQHKECRVNVSEDIGNCKRCGKCGIRDLIQVAEDNHMTIFIATGGSLARRVINEIKPDAVIAVACENDLSSGIADSYPLPVLGISNERPHGPCVNTRVDIAKIEDAIIFLSAG